MFQIICVFPHIDIEDERPGMKKRRILIRRGDDLQAATVQHQPCIAGAEDGERSFLELCPEIFRTSELTGQ